jgi:hypothetical protein
MYKGGSFHELRNIDNYLTPCSTHDLRSLQVTESLFSKSQTRFAKLTLETCRFVRGVASGTHQKGSKRVLMLCRACDIICQYFNDR